MKTEANGTYDGMISPESKPPRDVRVASYYFYTIAFFRLPHSVLMFSGVTEPGEPRRVLFGTVVIVNGLADGIYTLLTGLCWLFCAWGLMRGIKFAWWFAMIFLVYFLTDEVLLLPRYPLPFAIGIAIQILLIVWLWFRRGLYGIRLKKGA